MLCSPLRILPAVLFLLFKTTLVSAQGDDTISSVTTSAQVFDEFATFEWVWKGEAAHDELSLNLLIAGTADAKGNDVVDIMIANISSTQQTRFDYTFHPGLAGGVYHARMNGTIDNGNTLVSTTSALSNSFSLPDSGVPCSAGTFTPITSLTDPSYRPVRFTTPKGGDVIVQSALIGPVAFLGLQVDPIDMLFEP
ncbi:hypothetical protein C8F01DRAFT_1089851 [Mycena amicta]|nr:hypothetical protein C8F01DRAFT_1089851 [Mycena amicta]